MPQQSEDFADVIERSQRVTAADVGNPFAGKDAYVPGRPKNVPEHDFDAHVKVFAVPADAADYEDVMNQILHGEAVLRYEEKTFDKEGNFLVAICWLTPRLRPVQAINEGAGEAEPVVRPQRLP